MERLLKDLRFALRALGQRPGFTAVVVVTLALGIGANTAIFSVVQAVLLEPLPYGEPDRLVRLWSAYPERDAWRGATSPHDLTDWRQASATLESVAGYPAVRVSGLVRTGGEAPVELSTTYVTEGFFEALGVEAELGRTLGPGDQVPGENRVLVLAHGAWRRHFGADPAVVGSTVDIGGSNSGAGSGASTGFVVVGIMPPAFEYPDAAVEAWVPLSLIPDEGVPRRRFIRWLSVVGRLAPGATLEQARAELEGIASSLAAEYPEASEGLTAVTVEPLHDVMVGDLRTALLTIFAAVGAVLLVGCVNVASLALARSEERGREIAIRSALGAGRGALVRSLLTESLVLAGAGGLLGVIVGRQGVGVLLALAPAEIPRLSAVGIDGAVLAFAAALSMLTGVAVGLVPALQATRADLQVALKQGERGSDGHRRVALRSLTVAAETAVVFVVAVAAGLLLRSYASVLRVDPGFVAENVLTLQLNAGGDDYVSFLQQAVERVEALPGVDSAALGRPLPLRADTFQGEGIEFEVIGRPAATGEDALRASLRFVSPGYFRTLGIPLLAGRDFGPDDDGERPLVLVASRALVERVFPDDSPVGRRLSAGGEEGAEIVGVVDDVQQTSLTEEPGPILYAPFAQVSRRGMTLVVRSAADQGRLIGAIQQQIWDLRPDQPIRQIASLQTIVRESVAGPRFSTALVGAFAALALVLAAVGIYGVIAHGVGRRTREIGVRMALGARPGDVVAAVVRAAATPALAGLAAGTAVALLATRFLEELLFRVGARDPLTFLIVALALAGVAVAAALLPALRASRIDPLVALRAE